MLTIVIHNISTHAQWNVMFTWSVGWSEYLTKEFHINAIKPSVGTSGVVVSDYALTDYCEQ